MRTWLSAAACAACLCASAMADEAPAPDTRSTLDKGKAMFDEGKLLATGGVSQLEGAGGGGLASWALISGYETRDGVAVNAHLTYIDTTDYTLWTPGMAVGLFDRVELSYARQIFDTRAIGGALGLGSGFAFHQDIWGAKIKLAGDAVYDQDSVLPQIAVGAQFKHNDRGAVIAAVGGKSSTGTDFYLAATKLFLAQSLLADVTVRETKANQFGILGFGGDKSNAYHTEIETSAAYLFSKRFAAGAEYRTKPDNLSIAKEENTWDVFAAYFLNKNLSLTVAYVDLGNVVVRDQHCFYVSLQAGL